MEKQEWNQLVALKNELDNNLMAFDWVFMEKFTELLVESLQGKGDRPMGTVNRPLQDGQGDL